MGIQGLWQVLEPTGRPVNIHSLRGKVLAVDVSIWLHQLVKGFRDKDGNPLPNAHLLGVFHRVCKLLNSGIKPVFVFDGGVPVLKRQTLAARRTRKLESLDKAELSRQKILGAYLRQQLQRHAKQALPPSLRIQAKINELSNGNKRSPSVSPTKRKQASNSQSNEVGRKRDEEEIDEDLEDFRAALAAKLEDDVDEVQPRKRSDSEDESGDEHGYQYGVDYAENFPVIQAPEFDNLPLETQHEILFEMSESRKMNSWGKFDKMPKDLQNFSSFQMDRLVKRRTLQKKIQKVQQEMGQRHIHVQNLDDLLKMDYNFENKETKVGGSKNDGFVLIKSQEQKKDDDDEKKEPKPGSSTGMCATPEIITIDDFIEGSSSEEESNDVGKGIQSGSSFKDMHMRKRTQASGDEEDDLKRAIELSLQESQKFQQKKPRTEELGVVEESEEQPKFSDSIIQNAQASVETGESMEVDKLDGNDTTSVFNMQSKELKHCAKFLDTIGLYVPPSTTNSANAHEVESNSTRSKVQSAEAVAVKESASESEDDDFEEVEIDENPVLSDPMPLSVLLPDASLKKKSDTVATIDLSAITKSQNIHEDDLFADIFANPQDICKGEEENLGVDVEDKEEKYLKQLTNVVESSSIIDDDDNTICNTTPDIPVYTDEWGSDSEIEQDLLQMVEESTKKFQATSAVKNRALPSSVPSLPKTEAKDSSTSQSKKGQLSINDGQKPGTSTRMITAEYMQAQEQLNEDLAKLHTERGFQERVATSISDQMHIETQELIALFGIPYVISPTEAESQCAFLDRACLTEGTITDDSDVWLFGGQRVYKNFYSQGQRHIEFYQAADIQRVLNLNREKLVALAMLIGSDYSDGIQGVGPVLALEILSEFSSLEIDSFEILEKFREWWEEIQGKQSDVFAGSKVKEKLRKLKLRPGFPNKAVFEAFVNPSIDTSTEPFKWGNPDLDAIRSYTKFKFGWDQSKCDSMLLPVLKNRRCEAEQSRQLTLDSYISIGKMPTLEGNKRKKGSKRLQTAVKKLKRVGAESHELNLSSESEDEQEQKTNNNAKDMRKPSSSAKKSRQTEKVKASTANRSQQSNGASASSVPIPKPEVIPQRLQEESDKMKNKLKAIEIFKNRNKKAK